MLKNSNMLDRCKNPDLYDHVTARLKNEKIEPTQAFLTTSGSQDQPPSQHFNEFQSEVTPIFGLENMAQNSIRQFREDTEPISILESCKKSLFNDDEMSEWYSKL